MRERKFDVAVIGAGHAGIEAALACARMSASTLMFTLSLDAIGNMPCNPSVGGTAKGHLVRELDALGGEMGKAADATMLQSRMLNRGKGPAVHSLRVQVDRSLYHSYMKQVLENTPHLHVKQGEIATILVEEGRVIGVSTVLGMIYPVKAVIIATGTYLCGKVFIGDHIQDSGPDGMHPARFLSGCLSELGLPLRRFKTGTPARVDGRTIDYSQLTVQYGDEPPVYCSFSTDVTKLKNHRVCYSGFTNEKTHQIIRDNLHRSPLYGGSIEGVGPRYCPSIEDKVVRFSTKEKHPLFVEPMGLDTQEMYLQGMSSSLPLDVQLKFYRSIEGFSQVEIMRPAYAIEYDCVDPTVLDSRLAYRPIKGLFGAGQFCGSSGYEEAAVQGYVAGVNAVLEIRGQEPLILPRSSSYIGTLIDDLTVKGCSDPYRMLTSRSEYRLLLRQDNADQRLTPIGYGLGLISHERYAKHLEKWKQIQLEYHRVENATIAATPELNRFLLEHDTTPISQGIKFCELLRRPQLSYEEIASFDSASPKGLKREIGEQVEILYKYAGYLKKQEEQIARAKTLEKMVFPNNISYQAIRGLRLEAIEKLNTVRPETVGQAGRISGVTPADIAVLTLWLKQNGMLSST